MKTRYDEPSIRISITITDREHIFRTHFESLPQIFLSPTLVPDSLHVRFQENARGKFNGYALQIR